MPDVFPEILRIRFELLTHYDPHRLLSPLGIDLATVYPCLIRIMRIIRLAICPLPVGKGMNANKAVMKLGREDNR